MNFLTKLQNSKFSKVFKTVYQTLLFISGAFIVVAMVVTVFMRYVLRTNLFGMEEVILAVVIWFYFLGAVNGSMEDSQIRADLVTVIVKNEKVKRGIAIFSRIVEIVVLVFLIIMSFQLIMLNLERMPSTTALRIPYVIPQFSILLGFVLMLIYSIGHFIVILSSKPDENSPANN